MAGPRVPSRKRAKPKAQSRQPRAGRSLRILMIASEAQPFSKTGGLADVATALPKALGRLGHDVTLITPRYRGIADGPVVDSLSIEVAGASLHRQPDRSANRTRRAGAACSIALSCTIDQASTTTRAATTRTTRCALRSCRPPRSTGRHRKTIRSTSFTRTTGREASRRSMPGTEGAHGTCGA